MIESHLPALIALTFVLFAILIPAFGLWKPSTSQPLAVVGSGIASVLSLYGFLSYLQTGSIRYFFGGWEPPVGIEFVYDGLSGFFILVINTVAFFVLIHSRHVARTEYPGKEMPYFALAMLALLGFNGMILTGDLFNLYVFLEISSLASYGLIAIGSRPAPFAAFRYLIIGTAGGTLYLLGVGFLYTVTGTLNIIDMAAMLPSFATDTSVVAALVFMVVGIGVKAALFPLHGWLPDSYTFASSSSTALIAPIGTKVAAYILFRIVFYLFGVELTDAVAPITTVIGVLAAIGILYGSIMAIAQTEMKRMLAYSSVSQIGYIIMGLSLANPLGFAGALLHVLNHAVMKACLFLVAGNLRMKEGHSDISKFDDSYRKKYPWTMASFSVAAISMVGLPPLAGFFSKWYLALGTIDNENWLFLTVILVSSLLNAVYFFRILEKVYMMNPKKDQKEATDAKKDEVSASMLIPTSVLAIALFVIGFANAAIVAVLFDIFPM
ncbi:complex I subunit 5 family protein [Rhodohalobacter barkolensis]|uniref:NADH/ubiquinone/plastoquinone (Complex I) n=1 Tax=Rhodohalobacter barkolensis TaxID=2053187 RepID=A0A2N0VLR7_9BACT|nr:monovalent cation/H+ antiporter subunit D family protein [Rhodohalobacter barkolensis]PKD45138.1 NADH/ubiquinone/plastoquinone (complex I) [Rhodohalobacter barkolensis]